MSSQSDPKHSKINETVTKMQTTESPYVATLLPRILVE